MKVQRQEVQELEKTSFCIKITVNLELKLTVNVTVKFDTQYMKKKINGKYRSKISCRICNELNFKIYSESAA